MFRPWEVLNSESTSDGSSSQRTKRHLSADAQDIVLSVYNKLLKRMGDKGVIKETSELTNVPERTVYRIILAGSNHLPRKRKKISFQRVDNFTQEHVRKTVYSFYLKNEVPTLRDIHQSLIKSEVGFEYSETTLWRLLRKLGFKYGKLDERRSVMESPRLLLLREKFISEIRLRRSAGKSVIYLDETWFDTHDTLKKGYTDSSSNCTTKTPCSRGKRLIILHAGCEQGWIQGALLISSKHLKNSSADYHEDMDSELFEKWFSDQLLPNIPGNSVIVMDNASYHSRQAEKVPNTNTRKRDIISFLRIHNISVPENTTIKNLLKIVKSNNFEKTYVIDKLAKEAGHEIIRLPPYYCILNPIELMWSHIKQTVRKSNVTPTIGENVIQCVRNAVNSTNPIFWKNACEHVMKVENQFSRDQFRPFIINTFEDTDTEECTSDSN